MIIDGSLSLSGLDYIIVDTTFRDKKELHFFDLADVAADTKALFTILEKETKIIGF